MDLERLLVKDQPFSKNSAAADQRMGLFIKDGMTYFAPTVERDL